MKFLRYFFSYVTPDEPPEVPEEELPDPNIDRALSESFRVARRNLVGLCAACLAWATAQFSISDLQIEIAGVVLNLSNISIPLFLSITLVYLIFRWAMEFAMMPRNHRRWPLVQLDFTIVLNISRFSLLSVAAGALDRSLYTVVGLIFLLMMLALLSSLFSILLMFITMPIRMWARARADRPSVANSAFEAVFWATLFSLFFTVIGIIVFGVGIYYYTPLQEIIWFSPPNPIAFSVFILTLITVFLSYWFLRPVINSLFAERPYYRTERTNDGRMIIKHVEKTKEPLL